MRVLMGGPQPSKRGSRVTKSSRILEWNFGNIIKSFLAVTSLWVLNIIAVFCFPKCLSINLEQRRQSFWSKNRAEQSFPPPFLSELLGIYVFPVGNLLGPGARSPFAFAWCFSRLVPNKPAYSKDPLHPNHHHGRRVPNPPQCRHWRPNLITTTI